MDILLTIILCVCCAVFGGLTVFFWYNNKRDGTIDYLRTEDGGVAIQIVFKSDPVKSLKKSLLIFSARNVDKK